MCIAIVKTKDGKLTDEQLRNCFKNNKDGAGFAYVKDGVLYYMKGIFDEDQFIQAYHEIEPVAQGAMLIHCRISTSGLIDKDNCHPHIVHDNLVMIHNGVLDITVPKDSKISDTAIFCRDILRPLPKDFIYDAGILNLISFTIGWNNKFAFLNDRGDYAICNEAEGEWVDGVWFSNDSYKERTFKYLGASWYNRKDYKDYRDYYMDEYEIVTPNETQMILDTITEMTNEDLIKLGHSPSYDPVTKVIQREHEVGTYYLYDLSPEIDEWYELRYYNDMGGCYDTINVDSAEYASLEPYEQYMVRYWSENSTTKEEDEIFDDLYNDYYVDVLGDLECNDIKVVPIDYSEDRLNESEVV